MLAILLVVAVAAAMFEFRERNRARHTARNAQIHSLTVEAGARRASAADLALLLARQANELRDTPETRAALLAVLEEPPGLSHFLRTDAPVTAMAAGPTANTVVTGHANGNIVIWDPERREPLAGNASGDGSAVRAIAVNAETMRVASGTDDGLVQEWDVSTGSPLGAAITYLSPSDGAPVGVASVVYAADGLVVVGRDSTMRRYSATGETVAEEVMQERPNASDDLGLIQTVDRGGSVLARPGDGGVVLWDLHRPASAGIRGYFAMAPGSTVTALAIAPDGRAAATSAGNVLDLWDMTTVARLGDSIEFEQTVTSLAFAPDGATVAVGLVGGDVRVVDVARHAVMPATLGGATERVTALAFDVSGGSLYVGRAGGATTVYALGARSVVRPLPRYDGEGRSVAFGVARPHRGGRFRTRNGVVDRPAGRHIDGLGRARRPCRRTPSNGRVRGGDWRPCRSRRRGVGGGTRARGASCGGRDHHRARVRQQRPDACDRDIGRWRRGVRRRSRVCGAAGPSGCRDQLAGVR